MSQSVHPLARFQSGFVLGSILPDIEWPSLAAMHSCLQDAGVPEQLGKSKVIRPLETKNTNGGHHHTMQRDDIVSLIWWLLSLSA